MRRRTLKICWNNKNCIVGWPPIKAWMKYHIDRNGGCCPEIRYTAPNGRVSFHYGIMLFMASPLVGLLILLQVIYLGGPCTGSYCLDSYTISNVSEGSNRLCV